MNKFIKFWVLIICLLFIFLIIFTDRVNALTLINPTRVNADRTNGQTDNIGYNISTWWDNQFIEGKRNIGPWANGIIYKQQSYQWDNYGLCNGKTMLIEGEIGGLFDFFNQNYSVDVYNNGSKMSCYFARYDASRLKYSCSGIGGGQFIINVSYGTPQNAYTIGVSKVVNITCDASNNDIQNSINNLNTTMNNNTQNIINNNNQNTQSIINNQNQNAQQQHNDAQQQYNYISNTTISNENYTNTQAISDNNTNTQTKSVVMNFWLIPLNFFNSIIASFENTCSQVCVGECGNGSGGSHDNAWRFVFPCLDIKGFVGNTIYNTIDAFFAVGMIFAFVKRAKNFFINALMLTNDVASEVNVF